MSNSNTMEVIKFWVEDFVIKLNLCPFAKHPFQKGKIRFVEMEEKEFEKLIEEFWKEIILLEKRGGAEISNSILILKEGFEDFEKYLFLIEMCEDLLEMQQKEANFQIASFHPDYQFADSIDNDPRNFTNRSPLPLIHILRSEEVEKAIEFHPNTLEIPETNGQKLEDIGFENLKKMLSDYFKK